MPHVAATATSYQGLPGEYQLAYSNGNLYTTFANGRPPILTGGIGVWHENAAGPSLTQVLQPSTVDFTPRALTPPPVSRWQLLTVSQWTRLMALSG